MKNIVPVIIIFFCFNLYSQDREGFPGDIGKYNLEDSITNYQTDVSFNSITDGQPAPPLMPYYSFLGSGQSGNQFHYQFNLGYTPAEHGFLRNSLFGVVAPALDAGEGITDVARSLGISWLQRWNYEHNGSPTISSMISLLVPFNGSDLKTNIVATFIMAKNIRGGVLYLNAYGESQKGFTTDSLDYGFLGGYRMFLDGNKSLSLDLMCQRASVLTFEASMEFDLSHGWTIGPGINISYDGKAEDMGYGLGIILFRQTSRKLFQRRR